MALLDTKVLWSFTFLLAGAVAVGVVYPAPVCAVRGSTITLLCTFTPLQFFNRGGTRVRVEIVRVRWCQNHLVCQGKTPSVYDSNSTDNNPRYKYLGDKTGNCTLQITNVQEEDEATFRFRMEANDVEGHFTNQTGVTVKVSDAAVTINSSKGDRMLQTGDNVILQCTARCTFHHLKVAWFKDNHTLTESGPALQLGPLTTEDSGNYTCGLKTMGGTLSRPYILQLKAEHEDEEDGESVDLSVVVGATSGVLMVLFTLAIVLFIITRRRGADRELTTAGRALEHEYPDNIYSNECGGGARQQESSHVTEDVSYISVQFQHRSQTRAAVKAENDIIYSSVVSRG